MIDLLKRLARAYDKWRFYDTGEWFILEKIWATPEGIESETILQVADEAGISTEDCDRILAEHGMCMWVEPEDISMFADTWTGYYWNTADKKTCQNLSVGFPTKRAATEATFKAALEYIIKTKEGK